MPTTGPIDIPVPLSSFPGANQQESAGRLINCYTEPLGDPQQSNYGAPENGTVWRRMPGLTQFAITGLAGAGGYRGGMAAAGTDYEVFAGQAITVTSAGVTAVLGAFPGTSPVSIAINQNATSPDVVAVDPILGAYVLNSVVLPASIPLLLSGTSNSGDTISILFTNPAETLAQGSSWPVTVTTAALGAGGSAVAAATALVAAINANSVLTFSNVGAANVGGTSPNVTIFQTGIIGNQTNVGTFTSTGNRITGTFIPSSGQMSGGAGVAGTFNGTPTFYNGQTNLPIPNSVSFQDGYFFFTTANGSVYASGINTLTQNALTFGRIEAKADVTLLRGIPYQGYMFFFTTGSCEMWSDAAIAAPGFPYARTAILAYGLIQGSAIAGYETGFDDLLWVAQDFGVYRLIQGSQTPTKVSPPDLDRLIEAQIRAGDTLRASVYIFAGKKAWVLSSAKWTWQFHLSTMKWFERASLQSNGAVGQWRGIGGHPAFGKWLMGDQQSTAIFYIDDLNPFDIVLQNSTTWRTNKINMLMRIETGLVDRFPIRTRVARADFHFVQGVGAPIGSMPTAITGTSASVVGSGPKQVQMLVNKVTQGNQISIYNLSTQATTVLPIVGTFPSWTPDGRIIYGRGSPPDQIFIANADGTNPTQIGDLSLLGPADAGVLKPQLATNGLITFALGSVGIWSMQSNGSNLQQIISNGTSPSLALSGTWLSYTVHGVLGDGLEHNEIWRANSDGSNPVQLTTYTDPNYPDSNASEVSPDETKVVFFHGLEAQSPSDPPWGPINHNIAYVPASGGTPVLVTNYVRPTTQAQFNALANDAVFVADNPAWTPDGTGVIYDGGTKLGSEVRMVNLDGSNDQLIFAPVSAPAPRGSANVPMRSIAVNGPVRLLLPSTLGFNTGDQVQVSGVVGTVEANGVWQINVIDGTHIDLLGTIFVNSYRSGGIANDLQIEPDLLNPSVAVSWSDDGGISFRPPALRNLGQLSVVKTGRIAVKNTGLTGQIGRRWRMDISAPVYTAFLRATQSDDPTITQ